jgi:hypothetical protein
MNERIRELVASVDRIKDMYDVGPVQRAAIEDFAELIVRECEKVAKDSQWYSESPSNGWRNPIRHVCNVMKEHFGVEE